MFVAEGFAVGAWLELRSGEGDSVAPRQLSLEGMEAAAWLVIAVRWLALV